ncbi:MAG: alpha/beta hydrolase [Acidimicrobiales bacterium]|nr:alpha/beta hydrolase [Acidimicrobiales bacterium]
MAKHNPENQPPDMVLIHGLGSGPSFWDNIAGELSRDYTIHTVSLLGHGPGARPLSIEEASPSQLAHAVIDKLSEKDVERAHVVGLSLGGWVALELATTDFALSSVAFAPAGLWEQKPSVPSLHVQAVLRKGFFMLSPIVPHVIGFEPLTRMILKSNVVEPSKVTRSQMLSGMEDIVNAKGFGSCLRASLNSKFTGGSNIKVPTLVAFGDSDQLLTSPKSQNRSAVDQEVEWLTVADCGHAMTWDQPDKCLELIRRTAGKVSGPLC